MAFQVLMTFVSAHVCYNPTTELRAGLLWLEMPWALVQLHTLEAIGVGFDVDSMLSSLPTLRPSG